MIAGARVLILKSAFNQLCADFRKSSNGSRFFLALDFSYFSSELVLRLFVLVFTWIKIPKVIKGHFLILINDPHHYRLSLILTVA
jgi:hypothetical protein